MDLDAGLLCEAEAAFGVPERVTLVQDLLTWELDLIERVCGTDRYHDVTVFVTRDDGLTELALIHKPSDPPGAFWAPAGGVHAGESLAEAAVRETYEETGLTVTPARYVLRVEAEFREGGRVRPWTSHVFLARHVAGDPVPVDSREVETAAWVSTEAFWGTVAPIMRESGWGRFAYRLTMARLVFATLGLPSAALSG